MYSYIQRREQYWKITQVETQRELQGAILTIIIQMRS
ncbi:hypothetical protein M8J77_025766 [Diaphorina citri]|nr:hypothetical protein M8J77_025766 [Diaphorina citri]